MQMQQIFEIKCSWKFNISVLAWKSPQWSIKPVLIWKKSYFLIGLFYLNIYWFRKKYILNDNHGHYFASNLRDRFEGSGDAGKCLYINRAHQQQQS